MSEASERERKKKKAIELAPNSLRRHPFLSCKTQENAIILSSRRSKGGKDACLRADDSRQKVGSQLALECVCALAAPLCASVLEALGALEQLATHRAGELLGAVRIQLVIPQPVDGETSENEIERGKKLMYILILSKMVP